MQSATIHGLASIRFCALSSICSSLSLFQNQSMYHYTSRLNACLQFMDRVVSSQQTVKGSLEGNFPRSSKLVDSPSVCMSS